MPKGLTLNNERVRVLLAERREFSSMTPDIWVGSEDHRLKSSTAIKKSIYTPDYQYAPVDLENAKVHSTIQDAQGNIWAGIYQKRIIIPNSQIVLNT